MYKISKIIGREILDSRGNPTVEAEVHLDNGFIGLSSVPSGSSLSSKEALELRDGDKSRFFGKGVTKAVDSVNNYIRKALIGKDVRNQENLDSIMIELDGTPNKLKLGANAILAVSLASAKAAALSKRMPLYEHIAELQGIDKEFHIPMPMVNIINGGKHSNNNLDIQEFMIQPVGKTTFKKAIQMCSEIFHNLAGLLRENGMSTNVGDEGGYSPNFKSNIEALDFIKEAVKISGYTIGEDIDIALDIAASELFDKSSGRYKLRNENRFFDSYEFVNFLKEITERYPISSIEDGLSENDWDGFDYLTKILGDKIQLVGDDIFATNPEILQIGISKEVLNAIIIKPNQIGTLTETLNTIKIAKEANYKFIVSHRSGETEDAAISDLAVGTKSEKIKAGSMSRSDRIAKYNQLIRIEEYINNKIFF